jgi:hypothetical protein
MPSRQASQLASRDGIASAGQTPSVPSTARALLPFSLCASSTRKVAGLLLFAFSYMRISRKTRRWRRGLAASLDTGDRPHRPWKGNARTGIARSFVP